MKARPLIVFCDFDGTITEKDMVISICEKFCPPTWRQVVEAILDRSITVKEGITKMFAMIPSSKGQDILDFAHKTMKPRAGFMEFLTFCKQNGIRFIVCSGGVEFFIRPLMEPYKEWIDKIYAIPADFSSPMIQLTPNNACETEGMCKVSVMEKYPDAISILIGDSITDLHGARKANVVFARAGLKKYLDEEKIPYYPFETFHDVLKQLSQFQGPSHEKAQLA